MPLFFQHTVNENTRLGIWKIEETEEYFHHNVPVARTVTHPHKRLQHLAGRFLLQYLFPDFPYHLIEIADTRKPYLPGEEYHFSISHCGDYAAALVSRTQRVGVDIEEAGEKVVRVMNKFLHEVERARLEEWNLQIANSHLQLATSASPVILWSAKEAIFKWYGLGKVDFREHIRIREFDPAAGIIRCYFALTGQELEVQVHEVGGLALCWVIQ